MSDEKQPVEEDEGKAYLRRQAFEYQMKIAKLQSVGKKLPPGGIIYYNARAMMQMTGDEIQLYIARELQIPLECVNMRLVVEEDKVIPHVNLQIPKMWVTARGIKGGNDHELQAMAKITIDGVVKRATDLFAQIVARRMRTFERKLKDAK